MTSFCFKKSIILLSLVSLFTPGLASAGVSLSETRIIYNSDDSQESIGIRNSSSNDFLIQAWIIESTIPENDSSNDFIIAPPIFKLLGNESSNLTIVKSTEKNFASDKESLYYLNVKAIPSLTKAQRISTNKMMISVSNMIKLIYRPSNLPLPSESEYSKYVNWNISDGNITVINNSHYYVTFSSVTLNGKEIVQLLPKSMLSPNGGSMIIKSHDKNNKIEWTYINDFGAESQKIIVK